MGRIALITLLFLCIAAQPSGATELIEVGADSLLFSQIGTLVRVTDPGVDGTTLHLVESVSWIGINGMREYGESDWEIQAANVRLCPALAMFPGQVWKFVDDDFGLPRSAEAVRTETVIVPAGTFDNAWRVEVTRDDQPSVVNEIYWYVANVGLIKRSEFEGGQVVSKSELMSYDVMGLGFFPLEEGNTWNFTDGTVEIGPRSVGSLKDSFQR